MNAQEMERHLEAQGEPAGPDQPLSEGMLIWSHAVICLLGFAAGYFVCMLING